MSVTLDPTSTDALRKEVARRRTFAIISHPDAGKTTLTEKTLLYAGVGVGNDGKGAAPGHLLAQGVGGGGRVERDGHAPAILAARPGHPA